MEDCNALCGNLSLRLGLYFDVVVCSLPTSADGGKDSGGSLVAGYGPCRRALVVNGANLSLRLASITDIDARTLRLLHC